MLPKRKKKEEWIVLNYTGNGEGCVAGSTGGMGVIPYRSVSL